MYCKNEAMNSGHCFHHYHIKCTECASMNQHTSSGFGNGETSIDSDPTSTNPHGLGGRLSDICKAPNALSILFTSFSDRSVGFLGLIFSLQSRYCLL